MSAFTWEPLDFLDVLGVVPVEEDHAISYRYTLDQGPLHLTLTIWPMQGDVDLALRCHGVSEPVIHLNLLDCPGARIVDDKRGNISSSRQRTCLLVGTTIVAPRHTDFGFVLSPVFRSRPIATIVSGQPGHC